MNEEELIRETRKLIGRWDNVRIVGQGWAGDTRRGFQFSPVRTTSTEGTTPVTPSGACCPPSGDCFVATQAICEGGGGTYQGDSTTCLPDPCTPDSGACCVGSDCSIGSESDCIGMGGVFQGVGTTCSPNPCPQPTGACCVGTDCTIETESDCTGMGGTYQGDDTTCDPNPCPTCPVVSCACGFPEFIETDPTLRYLVKTYHYTRTAKQIAPSHPTCETTMDFTTTKTVTILGDCSCEMNTECSGEVTLTEEGEGDCNEPWVNSGTHEHDDDIGWGGGCHEAGSGCHACCDPACDDVGLTPSSPTTAEGDCDQINVTQTVHLSITATLSGPFHCTP